LDKKTGSRTSIPWDLLTLGNIYLRLGDWEKSEQLFAEAMEKARGTNDTLSAWWSHTGYGYLHFEKEEYATAKKWFEEGIDILIKSGSRPEDDSAYSFLVLTYIELGEIGKAQNLIDGMHNLALQTGEKWLNNKEMILKAGLLRAQRKWDESIELFQEALEEARSKKADVWYSHFFARRILCEYARACLERNRAGDEEKARGLLNQALEMFQKMGAKKDIEKTTRLLESLHPSVTEAHDRKISPERLESTEVQSNITANTRELKLGESLELEIEVTNTRKEGAILLTRIIEVIPAGFAVAKKPESCRMEGDCLNLKKKRLDPSETEEVKLVLTPKVQGTFYIKPKIVYLDENGKEKTSEPSPLSITVKELGIKGWLKGER
jgi:tetratricopeptide (TPR) repeat protein